MRNKVKDRPDSQLVILENFRGLHITEDCHLKCIKHGKKYLKKNMQMNGLVLWNIKLCGELSIQNNGAKIWE